MLQFDKVTQWFFDTSTCKVLENGKIKTELEWNDEEIIRLSGAPARSTVSLEKVTLSTQDKCDFSAIRMTVRNDILLAEPMVRDVVVIDEKATLTGIKNNVFELDSEFRGFRIGPRSLAIEIFQAKLLEIDYIDVWAVGNARYSQDRKDRYAMSGFAVWPRLGFDGQIPEAVHAKIPVDLNPSEMKQISDLIKFQGGIDFWDKEGDECKLRFDLSNETCWATLNSYLNANNIKVEL